MKNLILSGETNEGWNIESILEDENNKSIKDVVEKIEFYNIYEKRQEWYYNHAMSLNER